MQKFDRSIVDGPLAAAVWKLAWPTMLQNVIAGLQGIIDHAMVGHFIGYTANAAIGVSWQIFLVVIVFIASLYSGMGVLVARFTGAGEPEKVSRVVQQAFLTSLFLSVVLAVAGYLLAPVLLDVVRAAPPVKEAALPFLRTMFVGNVGMLVFFMLGGAFRAAGDARTPLRLGIAATVLNAAFNLVLIPGLGPIPQLGAFGAALGTVTANVIVALVGNAMVLSGKYVVRVPRPLNFAPDWAIIRSIFRFGLPTGLQGIAMNVAGVILLRFIGSLEYSAAAQAAYAVGYTELFSMITWTSVGLMSAAATITGQNLGAGKPQRSVDGAWVAARIGLGVAFVVGLAFVAIPSYLLGIFGMKEPHVLEIGAQLLRYLTVSGFFVTVALVYNGALQGTGDTTSPFYISLVSQIAIPLTYCAVMDAAHGLRSADIWTAIVLGHVMRATLGYLRFRQGKWRAIQVDITAAKA
ncbi:MAG: MATE family efflux transporter [Acidobacteria bacterium]|nr:MATE family efflux transporter [Acidobacteriota bacterium]